MAAGRNLNEQDYLLLSAYIDGELPDGERAALEQRLEDDEALRDELSALWGTVVLLNQLPPRRAPRDFTLTGRMVREGARRYRERRLLLFPATAAFSGLTAAAALLLVIFGALLLLEADSALESGVDSIPMQLREAIALLPTPAASPTPAAVGRESGDATAEVRDAASTAPREPQSEADADAEESAAEGGAGLGFGDPLAPLAGGGTAVTRGPSTASAEARASSPQAQSAPADQTGGDAQAFSLESGAPDDRGERAAPDADLPAPAPLPEVNTATAPQALATDAPTAPPGAQRELERGVDDGQPASARPDILLPGVADDEQRLLGVSLLIIGLIFAGLAAVTTVVRRRSA